MNPQVRETEPAQIAVPRNTLPATEINAIYIATPVAQIEAPAAHPQDEPGASMLDKRRRRRARLSRRH
ncbi:MAG: hypothetical protein AAFQ24_10600 [Pseudomonadota bacterium]